MNKASQMPVNPPAVEQVIADPFSALRDLADRDDARLGAFVLVPVTLVHKLVSPVGFDAQVAVSPEAVDAVLADVGHNGAIREVLAR